ncbi:hypothetical protein GEMRC1_004583 [Eukaryota sp. GEM-RC1]
MPKRRCCDISNLPDELRKPFVSINEAFQECLSYYSQQGYSLCKRKTNARGSYFHCNRGSSRLTHDDEGSSRNTRSFQLSCPFRIYCALTSTYILEGVGVYLDTPQFTLDIQCSDHNHDGAFNINVFSAHRWKSLTPETKLKVEKTLATCRSVRITRDILFQEGIRNLTLTDLYNINRRRKERAIGNSSALDYLINTYSDDVDFEFEIDDNGNIDHLLMVCKDNKELFKQFNSIVIMDCTYSTNKHKFPPHVNCWMDF